MHGYKMNTPQQQQHLQLRHLYDDTHCCILFRFCRSGPINSWKSVDSILVLVSNIIFFPFFIEKKAKNEQRENAVSIDIYGNWYKLCYEQFFSFEKREKKKKEYLSSNDSISLKIFSVVAFFIVADAASAATTTTTITATEVTRFLVWLFQSHHKMAVTFFNIWFTFLNSFMRASCYSIFAQQQHLKHQQKHRSPSTILPQLLLLLLYRDDVFPITFYNHSSSTHCMVSVVLEREDQTKPNSSIFHCSVRCCCETLKFEIFMCYSFASTSFRFPSSPHRPVHRSCVHRSLSYFSKYIMASKYISCALYT